MFNPFGEGDGYRPFLSLLPHQTGIKRDTTFAELKPSDYHYQTASNLSLIARKGAGKKRKAVTFATPTFATANAVVDLDPFLASRTHNFGVQEAMQVEDDEVKSIDPVELNKYENTHPIKKKTKLPGTNLKERIQRQLQDSSH